MFFFYVVVTLIALLVSWYLLDLAEQQHRRPDAPHSPLPPAAAARSLGGGVLGGGGGDVAVLGRTEAVFSGHGLGSGAWAGWGRLLDHHDVIFTMLAEVQLGKVEALDAGSLQLKGGSREIRAVHRLAMAKSR